LFDVEDARGSRLDIKLIREEYYCLPIAGVTYNLYFNKRILFIMQFIFLNKLLGLCGGMINEFLRIRGDFSPFTFQKLEDPFNDEI
jgi:hypothetical protein